MTKKAKKKDAVVRHPLTPPSRFSTSHDHLNNIDEDIVVFACQWPLYITAFMTIT